MDKNVRVFVNELCSSDRTYSIFKRKDGSFWEVMSVDSSIDSESALEAYEAAPVLKILPPDAVPQEILSLLKDSLDEVQKARLESLLQKGREFMYVEDSDGDTSYNFILFGAGEYYRYIQYE